MYMYNFYIDKMNVLFVFIITVFAYILSYKNFQYMDKDEMYFIMAFTVALLMGGRE